MGWLRLVPVFFVAVCIGFLLTPDRSQPVPEQRHERSWQESMELHVHENIPSITRNVADRLIEREMREIPAGNAALARDNEYEAWLLEWRSYHERAYRRFAPRKELLKRILQYQLSSASLEEIAVVQRRCGNGGADPWPVSVVVEGQRVVLPIDLSDWPELFEVEDAGIGPERLLEARILRDLRDGRLLAVIGEKEES